MKVLQLLDAGLISHHSLSTQTQVCLHDTKNLNVPLPCTSCPVQSAEFQSPQRRTKDRNCKFLSQEMKEGQLIFGYFYVEYVFERVPLYSAPHTHI